MTDPNLTDPTITDTPEQEVLAAPVILIGAGIVLVGWTAWKVMQATQKVMQDAIDSVRDDR